MARMGRKEILILIGIVEAAMTRCMTDTDILELRDDDGNPYFSSLGQVESLRAQVEKRWRAEVAGCDYEVEKIRTVKIIDTTVQRLYGYMGKKIGYTLKVKIDEVLLRAALLRYSVIVGPKRLSPVRHDEQTQGRLAGPARDESADQEEEA